MSPPRIRCRAQIEAEAVRDLARAAEELDRQSHGMGAAFSGEVERTVDRLTRFPDAFAPVHRSIRRARVGRFPYAVAYMVFAFELVIVAVLPEEPTPARAGPDPA